VPHLFLQLLSELNQRHLKCVEFEGFFLTTNLLNQSEKEQSFSKNYQTLIKESIIYRLLLKFIQTSAFIVFGHFLQN
jgi:hypothetical protein